MNEEDHFCFTFTPNQLKCNRTTSVAINHSALTTLFFQALYIISRHHGQSTEHKVRKMLHATEDKVRKMLHTTEDKMRKMLHTTEDKVRKMLHTSVYTLFWYVLQ